ncbi:MAG: hypothetical protein ACT6FE_08155 [Methanosarcinaceae archaeon]
MSLKDRIEVTQQVMVDLNPADGTAGPGMDTTHKYKGKISSFAAVTAAVCDMPGYIFIYSNIDSDGGWLFNGHSKMMMFWMLFLNVALDEEKSSMKPAARQSFNRYSDRSLQTRQSELRLIHRDP